MDDLNLLRLFVRESIENIGDINIHHLDVYEGPLRALVWATMNDFHDSIYSLENFFAMPENFKPDSVVGYVKVYSAGGEAGAPRVNFGSSLRVDPRFRRRGIATAMYRYIERNLGIELSPEAIQEPDGKHFWAAKKWRT